MGLAWLSAVLVGAGCLALGYLIGSKYHAKLLIRAGLIRERSVVDASNKKLGNRPKGKEPLEIENLADILEDFKMVLVVRNDLRMGKGKIAAQCSHATLGLYKKLLRRAPKALNRWEMCAQPKVVVKIESEEDMLVLQMARGWPPIPKVMVSRGLGDAKCSTLWGGLSDVERAKSLNLPTHITIDAGRTQIAPNSRTVMAILGPIEVVDDVTGGLKLL